MGPFLPALHFRDLTEKEKRVSRSFLEANLYHFLIRHKNDTIESNCMITAIDSLMG